MTTLQISRSDNALARVRCEVQASLEPEVSRLARSAAAQCLTSLTATKCAHMFVSKIDVLQGHIEPSAPSR